MSDSTQKDPQVIFCDVCTDEDRKPARKTCMKCEISMCVQHLQIHLTTPVLIQTHPLTEPMALCGTTKCPQHGKLLEYYCLDDRTCLCVSCAIEDQHRLHNMKTFSTAHKELMEKLSAEQQALLVKTDDENVSLEKWEKSEREKLGRCSVRLIEAVSKMRDAALTSVQSSVSARMVSMKTSKSSMQAAQEEKDTFRFLQMYSQVHQDMEKAKAVDLRKGLEPGSDRDKLVEEMRQGGEKMTEQADQLWCSLLTLVDPDNHQELIATSSDLIFDPQVLGPCMSLSENKRMVFYNSWMGQCSATLLISSIKSVPNFQRWVINLSEDYDWTVGLCDKQSAKNLKDGNVFGLCCKGDQLSFLTTEYDDCSDASMSPTKKPCRVSSKKIKCSDCSDASMPPTKKPCRVSSKTIKYSGKKGDEAISRPEMVEVFWNRAASSLSFFSRTGQHQRKEVLTIKMKINNSDLVAFVQLGEENTPNSSDWPHQQWRCSCGQIHSRRMNKYGNGTCQYPHQSNCSCGAIIGDACITKIICELV